MRKLTRNFVAMSESKLKTAMRYAKKGQAAVWVLLIDN
ncbi:hypothetical protein YPPY72_4476 [Yersinia pestis PY-72]|nr:hypothetical protein YPPY72_4476 [Yersinia pestis PY-72]